MGGVDDELDPEALAIMEEEMAAAMERATDRIATLFVRRVIKANMEKWMAEIVAEGGIQ